MFFRRGDRFEGGLAVVGRNNITFGAYGTGADPIITGSDSVMTNWNDEPSLSTTGNYVYSTVIPVDYATIKEASGFGAPRPMLMAFQGTDMLTLARTPNVISGDPGTEEGHWRPLSDWYLGVAAVYSQDPQPVLITNAIPGWVEDENIAAGDFNFSTDDPQFPQLVIRTQNYSIQVAEVVNVEPVNSRFLLATNIDQRYHSTPSPEDTDGWGYFIQNYREALDVAGEWFAEPDVPGTRLYVVMPTLVPPASGSVEVVVHGACFRFTDCSNITVQDLAFERAFFGVTFYSLDTQENNTVRNCSFRDLVIGVENTAGGANEGHLIEGNEFMDVHDMGIYVHAQQTTIAENKLSDIGRQPGRGEGVLGWGYFGIRASGQDVEIRDNILQDIGYAGIMAYGDGTQVRRNHITRWNSLLNDGGGVFFEGGSGMVVEDNVVLNSDPNMAGVPLEYSSNFPFSVGIYFGQNNLYNATARNNTVTGCTIGMLVDHMLGNFDDTHTIEGNTLFGNSSTQLYITDMSNKDSPGAPAGEVADGQLHVGSFPDVYTGNIMYALNSRQRCMTQISNWASDELELVDYGTFEGNHYHNPFSDVAILQLYRFDRQFIDNFLGSANDPKPLPWTLDGWRNKFEGEVTGTRSPLRLKDYVITDPVSVQPTGISELNHEFGENDEPLLPRWNSSSQNAPQGLSVFRYPEDIQQPMEALEHRNWYWFENWEDGSVLGYLDGAFPLPPPPVGNYRVTFNMRSPDVDMVGLSHLSAGPIVNMQFAALTPDWREQEFLITVPDDEGFFLATSFCNIHFDREERPAFQDASTIFLDMISCEMVEIDEEEAADQIASDHRLFYNCPLDGSLGDGLNVHDPLVQDGQPSSFTIPGDPGQCWSDVHGNLYAAGETYELDEWESVVLFRMDATYAIDVAEYPITEGNDEIWNTDRNVRGSVIVENGATLTIDGATIGFADSRQGDQVLTNILVEPGGMLQLLNGAHLTTVEGCGNRSMWDGVKVLSQFDPMLAIELDGVVMLSGSSRISNALTAVLCGTGDPAQPGYVNDYYQGHGGTVRAVDAIFENNVHDVVVKKRSSFFWAQSYPEPDPFGFYTYFGQVTFRNSSFLTTSKLNYPELHPVAHVRLVDQNRTPFWNCTFLNDLDLYANSTEMTSQELGFGIEAFNSGLEVGGEFMGQPAPNTFTNLDHGIHATASSGNPYLVVEGNTFTDNICGLYIADLPGFTVQGNVLEMGKWSEVELTGVDATFFLHHRGIFSTGGYAFNISENVLGRSANGTALTEGIVVGYTQEHNDIVFDNTASGLDVGYAGEGICADVNNLLGNANTQGLQFQCNTNQNNEVNIWSRRIDGVPDQESHTIRGFQGANGTDLSPARAASNTFDRTIGREDFRVSTENLSQIRYFHKASPLSKIPLYFTEGTVSLVPEEIPSGALDACATPGIWPGGTKPALRAEVLDNKEAHGNLRYLLAQLVDGGNTDAVVQEIVGAWPQDIWDLRTYLLSLSPYLSVDALMQVVNKDIPIAVKAEILVANPEATQKDGFLKWAEFDANYPLPEYILASVMASWNTRTYRTTLEMQMADKHTAMTQAANGLLYCYHTDTLPANPDSLRWVWQQIRTNGARYAEAVLLMDEGHFAQADSLIQAMPSERSMRPKEEDERQRMLIYIGVLAAAAADDRSAYELYTEEVSTLEQMARDHYDRPSNWANNLLCAVYKKCRAPWTGGSAEIKALNYRELEVAEEPNHRLSLLPNPTRSHVAVDYVIPEETGASLLTVRDLAGRSLHQQRIAGPQGQVLLDTRMFGSGTYLVVIEADGRMIATERLIVQQ